MLPLMFSIDSIPKCLRGPLSVIAILAGAAATPNCTGTVVTWPGNGHSYEAVFLPDNPTWFDSRDAAAAMTYGGQPGHLATWTTRDEQEFVVAALGGETLLQGLWLGGYQDTSAPDYLEPYGGWKWITGEPWLGVAVNDPVLPRSDAGFNNTYFVDSLSEEYTITWWDSGGINDYYPTPSYSFGFIVEYEASAAVPESTTAWVGVGLALGGLFVRSRGRRSTGSGS